MTKEADGVSEDSAGEPVDIVVAGNFESCDWPLLHIDRLALDCNCEATVHYSNLHFVPHGARWRIVVFVRGSKV